MGIEVVIEDEQGNRVKSLEDPRNILHRVLPQPRDATYSCLNRVDWYGDTTFNRYQLSDVRSELQRIINAHPGAEEHAFLQKLSALVNECDKSPHLYLKFYGD